MGVAFVTSVAGAVAAVFSPPVLAKIRQQLFQVRSVTGTIVESKVVRVQPRRGSRPTFKEEVGYLDGGGTSTTRKPVLWSRAVGCSA